MGLLSTEEISEKIKSASGLIELSLLRRYIDSNFCYYCLVELEFLKLAIENKEDYLSYHCSIRTKLEGIDFLIESICLN